MKTRKDTTKVVFRKFKNGEIIALFPDFKENNYCIMSYMHIGQHGAASPDLVYDTKLAAPQEYKPLLAELRAIGYRNLEIRKRMTIRF